MIIKLDKKLLSVISEGFLKSIYFEKSFKILELKIILITNKKSSSYFI